MKQAIVYDRWLQTLGGGEVVACNIAKILKDQGYKVTFVCGKKVSKEIIYEKLRISMMGIEFVQIWNDEYALKKLTIGKDLFINISFMDYSRGFAKKNIYFVNFPTRSYMSLKGLVFSAITPFITHFIKPIESMNILDTPLIIQGVPAYLLGHNNRYAISNLSVGKPQTIIFSLLLENFSKTQLEKVSLNLENAEMISKKIAVYHRSNVISFNLLVNPASNTMYLNINIKDFGKATHDIDQGKMYLLYPKIELKKLSPFFFVEMLEKFRIRMRAGIFVDILGRLKTYQTILTYSAFAEKWINKYWKRRSKIIAPPVSLIFEDHKLNRIKKKNWICSVGRFFTLGHGKKQEVMIHAFKKLYDKGYKDWELHLAGGLGSEPSSLEFFQYLKDQSEGYPIFFHINISRKEIEEIYLKSKIYWHATGFDEDENYQPVRFEHFGISPIEAISAGCIPILYYGGGLPEIIDQLNLEKEKYLFKNIDSLVNLTKNQIEKPSLISFEDLFKILKNTYSKEVFKKKILEIINT